MKPGRELDALIAEKIMGGVRHKEHSVLAVDVSAKTFTLGEGWEYPRYSSDIESAWEIVGKLKDRGFNLWRATDGDYYVHFHRPGSYAWGTPQAKERSAAYAICLAALTAMVIDVDSQSEL